MEIPSCWSNICELSTHGLLYVVLTLKLDLNNCARISRFHLSDNEVYMFLGSSIRKYQFNDRNIQFRLSIHHITTISPSKQLAVMRQRRHFVLQCYCNTYSNIWATITYYETCRILHSLVQSFVFLKFSSENCAQELILCSLSVSQAEVIKPRRMACCFRN